MKTEHAARGARCSNSLCLGAAVVAIAGALYCLPCADVVAPTLVRAGESMSPEQVADRCRDARAREGDPMLLASIADLAHAGLAAHRERLPAVEAEIDALVREIDRRLCAKRAVTR